jgi:hypothetical protein
MGRLLRRSGDKRARLSCLLHQGISAICPSSEVTGPRGPREAWCRRRLPRGSTRHRILSCEYSEGSMQEYRHRPQCVCRQRGARGSRDCRAVKLLSTQIVRKQAKAFSSRTTLHIACKAVVNAFQQYEWLACLAIAKLGRRCAILELAHPPFFDNARIHWGFTMGRC